MQNKVFIIFKLFSPWIFLSTFVENKLENIEIFYKQIAQKESYILKNVLCT